MNRLFSNRIGEASKALGVSITPLRHWEAEGRLIPEHTLQEDIVDIAHYDLAKLKSELYHCSPDERYTIF